MFKPKRRADGCHSNPQKIHEEEREGGKRCTVLTGRLNGRKASSSVAHTGISLTDRAVE